VYVDPAAHATSLAESRRRGVVEPEPTDERGHAVGTRVQLQMFDQDFVGENEFMGHSVVPVTQMMFVDESSGELLPNHAEMRWATPLPAHHPGVNVDEETARPVTKTPSPDHSLWRQKRPWVQAKLSVCEPRYQ
jgi:hypothetical protein